ncbi:hypothetical protein G6F31_020032 [Rhizopus arrhizus]|nr:hypothetical protein G6F24_017142 [Rhizopus arrhizus]KAG0922133.1 hypothetical protein G6F31_020032 [Rhizopus arrhizus]
MAFISTSLTLIDGICWAGRASVGRWPYGNGPATSSCTVLAWVGLAPLPASITRYWTPLGRDCTPALALFAAMN